MYYIVRALHAKWHGTYHPPVVWPSGYHVITTKGCKPTVHCIYGHNEHHMVIYRKWDKPTQRKEQCSTATLILPLLLSTPSNHSPEAVIHLPYTVHLNSGHQIKVCILTKAYRHFQLAYKIICTEGPQRAYKSICTEGPKRAYKSICTEGPQRAYKSICTEGPKACI